MKKHKLQWLNSLKMHHLLSCWTIPMSSSGLFGRMGVLLRQVYSYTSDDDYNNMINFLDDVEEHFASHLGDTNLDYYEWMEELARVDNDVFSRVSYDLNFLHKFVGILLAVIGDNINLNPFLI